MRNIKFIIGVFILCCTLTLNAATTDESENRLKDSLIREYSLKPDPEEAFSYMHNEFHKHISEDWIIELLDTALIDMQMARQCSLELSTLYDYTLYYRHRSDIKQIENLLPELKEKGVKAYLLNAYFKAWGGLIDLWTVSGHTEMVMQETDRMLQEAKEYKWERGTVIALIAKARTYAIIDQYEEAIKMNLETLKLTILSTWERGSTYRDLSQYYLAEKRYDEAIDALNKYKEYVELLVIENPRNKGTFLIYFLELELRFAEIYIHKAETDQIKKHLELAKKLEPEKSLFSLKMTYHSFCATYYRMISDKDNCYRMFGEVINDFNGIQSLTELSILVDMAEAQTYFGDYEKAAKLYGEIISRRDSVYKDIIANHEDIHNANRDIQNALVDKARNEGYINAIFIAIAVVSLIFVIIILLRNLKVRRIFKHSREGVKKALAIAENENKLKENFLRNITNRINEPLTRIVELSDSLTHYKELTQEEQKRNSEEIQKDATYLIRLVVSVLDLSRMEAGMSKLGDNTYKLSSLFNNLKTRLDEEIEVLPVEFGNIDSEAEIKTDEQQFLRMIVGLVANHRSYIEPKTVTISSTKNDNNILITLSCSHYEQNVEFKENHVIHTLNHLFIEHYGGTYELTQQDVRISYPLSSND